MSADGHDSSMSYIAERRQEERDRRRTEIVDAADALYAEVGWDTVTMDQVARRARLSRALVYVYFKDKSDLHLALVERALETLRSRFDSARAGKACGIDEIEAIGRAYVAFSREMPHYYDACSRYQSHACGEACTDAEVPPTEAACMSAGHRVHETLVDSLNRGVADGSIRADLGEPYVTALALWAFTHGVIQIASSKGGQIEHEGVPVQRFIDHSFALVLGALRA
jgi:TetR/AcrR family transcriptional regulator